MKASIKAKKLAKQVWTASQTKDGPDEVKFQKMTALLSSSDSSLAKQILSQLVKIAEQFDKEQTLLIESPFRLDEGSTIELQQSFERQTSKKLTLLENIDKTLVAGVRITNGDDVWENSLHSYLENLKGSLANE